MSWQGLSSVNLQAEKQSPVVVIEDCEEDFTVIKHGLSKHATNYPILHFSESHTARAWLEETQAPARLILLDLNLPGETGHSLLDTLKSHATHKMTPIVILSSSRDTRDVEACYEAGANSYHTKPLETERFYQTLQEIAEYWLNSAYYIKG